jgi:O-acetyl-ADP-ribose deacetylase (regulator of RNase III)
MSGLKDKLKVVADPANFFGKRSGGVDWADAMDPGGKLINTVTGSNIGRKAADPLKLISDGTVYQAPETVLTYEEKREKRLAGESILSAAQKRKRAANRSILTTTIDDELS